MQISESLAIPQYLVYRYNRPELFGKDYISKGQCLMIIGVLNDLSTIILKIIYSENYKEKLSKSRNTFKNKLKGINNMIGKKKWCLGFITYADFILGFIYFHIKNILQKLKSGINFDEF